MIIEALDKTLENLLRRDFPESLGNLNISFEIPDDQFPPQSVTLPAIDLFLYDIRENNDLRSNEWLVTRGSDGVGTKSPPPVRVDFSYLVTAWSSSGVRFPALDEHRLLGAVMVSLLRYPKIPKEDLAGELRNQELPLPTTALQSGRLQSLGEFWQAIGGKPKAALNYTVTVGVAVWPDVQVPLVTDTTVTLRPGKDLVNQL